MLRLRIETTLCNQILTKKLLIFFSRNCKKMIPQTPIQIKNLPVREEEERAMRRRRRRSEGERKNR